MPMLTRQVQGGPFDAHEADDNTGFANGTVALDCSSDALASVRFNAGFVFSDVQIPQGAIINSAVLLVAVRTSAGAIGLEIFGEASDNALDFTVPPFGLDVTNRIRTVARVDWDGDKPTVAEVGSGKSTAQSPDISSVIQEITDRPGWVSGTNMGILLDGKTSPDVNFEIDAFEQGNFAAMLQVVYGEQPRQAPAAAFGPQVVKVLDEVVAI